MKIKLGIVENNKSYLNRIVSVFSTKYSDKFEVYSFTDIDIALQTIVSTKIDVLLADEYFDLDVSTVPKKCAFAYLVDSPDIDTFNGSVSICKFQKVDLIYKQILSIYSEKAGNLSGIKLSDSDCRVIAFSSPCGGTGTSTVAASYAKRLASFGEKTIYLNLEPYGSSDAFFSGEGQFSMSDVIFAIKSKKTNLSMKLESCVKQDDSGVCFYSQPEQALDMFELTVDDILRLIAELKIIGSYVNIIVDMPFSLDKEHIKVFEQAVSIILVGDGSKISNQKIFRAYNALSLQEQNNDVKISNRMLLFYNKFSSKTSKALDNIDLKNIGGAPRYEHATTAQILGQLSVLGAYDRIKN